MGIEVEIQCGDDVEQCLDCDHPERGDCVLYKVAKNNCIVIPFLDIREQKPMAIRLDAQTYFDNIKMIPIYN